MSKAPWLTIIGLGEDGQNGLTTASLAALKAADIVMGPPRHLSLLGDLGVETIAWPVPFSDGIERLLALRGRRVAVLASGDPFWFGAGSVLARHLTPEEWQAFPGQSCFALAANRLGWPLETLTCTGLHAAPLTRLRPHLAPGTRIITTLRDGDGPQALAAYLVAQGFGDSTLHILQALGGPRETHTGIAASDLSDEASFTHPLCVAIDVAGTGRAMALSSGQSDDWFDNDGQITKRPVRALTLSALAPRFGDHLWDIGGGSGSIAIEWLLSGRSLHATSIEADPTRAARITANAAKLGVDHLQVVTGRAPDALQGLRRPDAVFVGGGLSADLLDHLQTAAKGARLVVNAVTLESEALVTQAQRTIGGDLLRVELAQAQPLGTLRGWKSAYPIVQWSFTL
ncbi:precorrin-6y C5,15-methyltransferase (decarboxylating) subunit CbiE [Marinovum sp. KMM 9879]